MKHINTFDNKGMVFDNLVATTEMSLARYGHEQLKLPARFPRTYKGFKYLFNLYFDGDIPIPVDEMEFWQERVWQIFTSCKDRRVTEYEETSYSTTHENCSISR